MAVQLDHDELVQQYQNAVHQWELICKRADRHAQSLAGLQLLHSAELQMQRARGYGQIYTEYQRLLRLASKAEKQEVVALQKLTQAKLVLYR